MNIIQLELNYIMAHLLMCIMLIHLRTILGATASNVLECHYLAPSASPLLRGRPVDLSAENFEGLPNAPFCTRGAAQCT